MDREATLLYLPERATGQCSQLTKMTTTVNREDPVLFYDEGRAP